MDPMYFEQTDENGNVYYYDNKGRAEYFKDNKPMLSWSDGCCPFVNLKPAYELSKNLGVRIFVGQEGDGTLRLVAKDGTPFVICWGEVPTNFEKFVGCITNQSRFSSVVNMVEDMPKELFTRFPSLSEIILVGYERKCFEEVKGKKDAELSDYVKKVKETVTKLNKLFDEKEAGQSEKTEEFRQMFKRDRGNGGKE